MALMRGVHLAVYDRPNQPRHVQALVWLNFHSSGTPTAGQLDITLRRDLCHGLRSLQENIDTASIGGRLVFHLFGALAEFERNLIRERTQAGLIAARARGRKGGRKMRLDPVKREVALKLYHERKHTVEEIYRMMGVGRSTLYNYLTQAERDVIQTATA